MSLNEKTILVTGGSGSFGTRFAETALREYRVKAIRIFSRGEARQHEMRLRFNNDNRLRFLIGDVRDRHRLYRAMKNVDIVIHAAAMKQVPGCEYNPIEAVKTNINGGMNVIDAAIDTGVKKVVALSTDKAVYPINLYGATKLVAEKLFIQANAYAGADGPMFSCVRYGNIIGSQGSLVPLLKKQVPSGVVTITDSKMTRFWITQDQAVNFVIFCIDQMAGREIFVPKIASMKLIDLVTVVAPGIKQNIVGTRPGEKTHETLVTREESPYTEEFSRYFVIRPRFSPEDKRATEIGKASSKSFEYTSENNKDWLSTVDLTAILSRENLM